MRSYVVTGSGRGVGRAIAERLMKNGHVVVLDLDAEAIGWAKEAPRTTATAGDAGDDRVTARAADAAGAQGALAGWVNNAAIFEDASIHDTTPAAVVDLISANLGLAIAGCATAVRRFLNAGTAGAIVNVSSHQATRRSAAHYRTRRRRQRSKG